MPKRNPLPQQPTADPSGPSDGALDPEFLAATQSVPAFIADDEGQQAQEQEPEKEKTPFPPQLVEKALEPTFRVIFNAIADRRGEHWKLEPYQTEALVAGWTPIVTLLLERLGSTEQTLLVVALMTTGAVVGGKIAQDATKQASSKVSTKTPLYAASPASSVSAAPAKPPEPELSSEMLEG